MTAHYLRPNSLLTLAEGLEELRALEAAQDNEASENFAPELQQELTQHDLIHVLFGCSTDLKGEIQAHVWTIFGTTLSRQQMHQVNAHDDHKSALQEIGHTRLLRTWLRLIPSLLGIFWRARRMTKKFPIKQAAHYLHQPLQNIRKEFNIQL